jgi:hypothetical protein
MKEEIKANPTEAVTHEAQLAAENMATGVEEAPNVDIEGDYEASKAYSVSDVDRSQAGGNAADYEASKAYSVSDVDRSQAGGNAAESATASKFEISQPEETTSQAQPTGNPKEFRAMAHDVNHRTDEPSASSDDLVDKAIEMGKPGK